MSLPEARDGFVRISADAEVRINSKAAEKYGYTPGKKEVKEEKPEPPKPENKVAKKKVVKKEAE